MKIVFEFSMNEEFATAVKHVYMMVGYLWFVEFMSDQYAFSYAYFLESHFFFHLWHPIPYGSARNDFIFSTTGIGR